jgi:hypothetical protein
VCISKTTLEERMFGSRDPRVFSLEKGFASAEGKSAYPATYISTSDNDPKINLPPYDDIQRHQLQVFYSNGPSVKNVKWYEVGKISARGVAELGQAFGLPREIDNIIYSQITGKTRKLATPEERSKNLSKLSEKINEERMAKPTSTSHSNVNKGGRKSRKRNSI